MKYDSFYDFVCHELEELDEKAKADKVSMTDVQYADMLEHYKKSCLTNEAMEGEGYSNRGYMPHWGGYAYEGDRMGGNSYAGRMNAKRDSMGRYSSERGYSRDGMEMADQLRDLMKDAPDESVRRDIERLLRKVEQM